MNEPHFGFTVIRRDTAPEGFFVYKRDSPADKEHYAEDLAPFTFNTKAEAIASGRRGHYAYKPPSHPLREVVIIYYHAGQLTSLRSGGNCLDDAKALKDAGLDVVGIFDAEDVDSPWCLERE